VSTDAALYQRVSDGTDKSVEQQNTDNEKAARGFGWGTKSYSDAVSASRFGIGKARPGWAALTADVAAGRFGYVVLWESSRGDRKLATWAAFLDACRETDTRIYVTSQARLFDMRNGYDWKELAGQGVDSAFEPEKTSLRTRRGVNNAAEAGIPYGRIPYGYARTYTREPGRARPMPHQYPDPKEAPVVREIVTRIAQGEAVNRVERDMYDRGIFRRDGRRWARASLVRMVLEGVVYIGKRRHNGGPLLPGDWPPLVEEDVYWRAVAVLRDPARKTQAEGRGGIRTGRAKWLLSHIATCSSCGSPLGMTSHGRPERYYRCTGSGGCACVPMAWLDTLVTDAVIAWCSRPGVYEAITGTDDAAALAARDEASAERARLADFEQQAVDKKISPASFARIAAGIEATIARLDSQASALSTPPALRDLLGETRESRQEDIRDRWNGMTIDAQRRVVRAIFELRLRPLSETGGELCDPARVLVTWPEWRRIHAPVV
jgi:site-specific DNA recombinase